MNKTMICLNCGKEVKLSDFLGTKNRNHCPFCLWSKHVDVSLGDRKSKCEGGMKPIGLTFKQEGFDKYSQAKQGELMAVHQCVKCGKISINRIAGDDDPETILKVFENSVQISPQENIKILTEKNRAEVLIQLFGS